MKTYGAFEVESKSILKHLKKINIDAKQVSVDEQTNLAKVDGKAVGLRTKDGSIVEGFPTPSKKQEIYSLMMKEWGWAEYATPGYIKSHIHWENMDAGQGDLCLIPTFRLPTLIHSRTGNAKWLAEISNTNPTWMNADTAKKFGLKSGDLIRITTEIGYYVNKVWVTEGLRPDVIAVSHHLGRWRRPQDATSNIWATITVALTNNGSSWSLKNLNGVTGEKSSDPDTSRIYWNDGGVHQNIAYPVHPDPISGMMDWHQKVRVTKAEPGDKFGDISVDTNKSHEIYKQWLQKTKPGPVNGLRLPKW